MFQTFVWSKIKHKVNSKQCFFQQDGAPPHWRTEVLEWLTSKFQDRLISHKTPRPWPAKSPDLSPLDYWFWSAAMAEVRRIQPKSLDDLKDCVEAYAISLSREQVNKAVCDIFFRAKCCVQKNGGQFESLLKKQKAKKSGDN